MRRFSFVSNFKKLIFARLFSLNFSVKSLWCSPVLLKFESYNLQHCKKSCLKLFFCTFPKQLMSHIIFGLLYRYEVSLVKKYDKVLLQKSETNIFKQKWFHKKLVQNQREKKIERFELNQIISKLLTLSKCFQSNR